MTPVFGFSITNGIHPQTQNPWHLLQQIVNFLMSLANIMTMCNNIITQFQKHVRAMSTRRVLLLSNEIPTNKINIQSDIGVSEEFFCGLLHSTHQEVFEEMFRTRFRHSFVSYLKERNDKFAVSTWVYRRWILAPLQLHVILFEGEDTIYVYAHHEYNSIRHPIKHLRLEYINSEYGKYLFEDFITDEFEYTPREELPDCAPDCKPTEKYIYMD